MLSHTQNSTRFISTSTPLAVRRVTYTRYMGRTFILTGIILEERQVEVKRWPGIVVTEYRVRNLKTKGVHCFSEHWVNESDVLNISDVTRCPRCDNHGFIAIYGDDSIECPVCNPVDMEITY